MSNSIVSPGIYINENDQSFIPEGIVAAGAAIVGPTVKGPVEIPTLVSSYTDYVAKYGDILESGSGTYAFFTSTAAYNYFNNGGDTLLVSRVVSGSYSNATASPSASSGTPFVINTFAEGAEQNSGAAAANEDGAFPSGSKNNLRFEIINSNTGSGTFTLKIRRGDDDNNNQIILEQWNGLTLDPFDSNFIGRIVGTQHMVINNDGEATAYVSSEGDYPNNSKFVYISDINETPNYLDAAGNIRVSGSEQKIPLNTESSGSTDGGFTGGQGSIGAGALFGKDISSSNMQGVGASSYTQSFYLLKDPQFSYTSVVAPGLDYTNHATELNILLNNTKERADAIAVIDMQNYTSSAVLGAANLAKTVNNSYGATYFPWLLAQDPVTSRLTWAPPSTFIPGVYAFNDKVGEPWFAPAGFSRGALPTVVKTQISLPKTDRDTLYEAKVNPITTFPRVGVVVFGQKTLQSKASALDRINVRRLLITIKQFLDQQAGNIVFEQNTIATRNNFLAIVNPYLESVQQRQGLYAFKVIMDESINTPDVIDRNELVGQVYLQPTKTAEFIILNFNIQRTGATFPE